MFAHFFFSLSLSKQNQTKISLPISFNVYNASITIFPNHLCSSQYFFFLFSIFFSFGKTIINQSGVSSTMFCFHRSGWNGGQRRDWITSGAGKWDESMAMLNFTNEDAGQRDRERNATRADSRQTYTLTSPINTLCHASASLSFPPFLRPKGSRANAAELPLC